VEAYIPEHAAFVWPCTRRLIPGDTADAHYVIHHAAGAQERRLSQQPLANQWLDLGEYPFAAGQSGYVTLSDLNAEADFTRTVSFSALRFTLVKEPEPTPSPTPTSTPSPTPSVTPTPSPTTPAAKAPAVSIYLPALVRE
jgi:hypothetical protein